MLMEMFTGNDSLGYNVPCAPITTLSFQANALCLLCLVGGVGMLRYLIELSLNQIFQCD